LSEGEDVEMGLELPTRDKKNTRQQAKVQFVYGRYSWIKPETEKKDRKRFSLSLYPSVVDRL